MADNSIFDIAAEAVEETGTLHLKSAKGEFLFADKERSKPVRIILYGPGSHTFGVLEARKEARAYKRVRENGGKVESLPFETVHQDQAEDLAFLTKGFENFSYRVADKLDGPALHQAVYADLKLGFVVRQVNQFLNDWGNFKSA